MGAVRILVSRFIPALTSAGPVSVSDYVFALPFWIFFAPQGPDRIHIRTHKLDGERMVVIFFDLWWTFVSVMQCVWFFS